MLRKLTVVFVLVLALMFVSACAGANTSNQVNNDSSTNIDNVGAVNEPGTDNAAAANNMDKNDNQNEGAGGGGMAGEDLVTIAKSETQIAQLEEPALYILSAPDEFEGIAKWFSPEERDAVAAVDYDSNYLGSSLLRCGIHLRPLDHRPGSVSRGWCGQGDRGEGRRTRRLDGCRCDQLPIPASRHPKGQHECAGWRSLGR